jgi:hypothetical protein
MKIARGFFLLKTTNNIKIALERLISSNERRLI